MDLPAAIALASRQDQRPWNDWRTAEPVQPSLFPSRGFAPGVTAIGWEDAGYPEGARHLVVPPAALFVRGAAWPAPAPRVAMIGARHCTEEGRFITRDLARALSREGIVVISGLALGIDAAAHEGAILGPTPTLAVLASDVDHPTPTQHRGLARAILDGGGWLVSERPPGAPVRPQDFPRRNRIVAALADLVLVVEAGLRSGTLSTVEFALSLGVEVAAVPGSVASPASQGTNALIQAGAHVATSAADLLGLIRKVGSRTPRPALDPDADRVLAGVPGGNASRDRWVAASGLGEVAARSALLRLIACGALRVLPGGRLGRVL